MLGLFGESIRTLVVRPYSPLLATGRGEKAARAADDHAAWIQF